MEMETSRQPSPQKSGLAVSNANGITLYFEGDPLYQAMIESINGARNRVWLESYIFAEDEVGQRFASALSEAVDRGVDVRLHLDAAGSLFEAGRSFLAQLRRQGIPLRRFHRWSWRDPFRYNRRNHCKLLIIDASHIYVGGFNIHRESAAAYSEAHSWRDSHARIDSGHLVEQAEILFDLFWSRRWRDPTRQSAADLAKARLQLVSNRGPRQGHTLRKLYRDALDDARHCVRLTTPYFIPDPRTMLCLRRAARRGVDVQLLLPGVTDQPLLQIVARRQYWRLVKAGVRIYEYRHRVLHAKTLTADGKFAILGTANFDYRSLFHNYELNLLARDGAVTQALDDQFALDLDNAELINEENLPEPSLFERLVGRLGWLFRRWL
jgi:cardiolipin synthase A/B